MAPQLLKEGFRSAALVRVLRNTAAAMALILVGLLPGVSRSDNLQGQQIWILNKSQRTIWVAVRYIPPGSTSYVNDGYWKVEPGQRRLIVYNNGVILYAHAHDADGREHRGNGNPVTETIRGRTVDLYPVDTTDSFRPWLITYFDQ